MVQVRLQQLFLQQVVQWLWQQLWLEEWFHHLQSFVATLLLKNKFTKEERNSGLTNIVMGLSFITEGAIPFGAADPARAIPSFILGSAVAGDSLVLLVSNYGSHTEDLRYRPYFKCSLLYLVSVLVGDNLVSGVVLWLPTQTTK